jgi:hypothetical protein
MITGLFRKAVFLYLLVLVPNYANAQKLDVAGAHSKNAKSSNPFAEFREFSAIINGGLGDDHDRRIYRSGDLMRLDFDDDYRVTDLKNLTMWAVKQRQCVVLLAPDAGTYPFSAYRDHKIERSPTEEREVIDGHMSRIENVTFTPNDGGPLVVKMKLWEAEDLNGFPTKVEVDAGRGRPPLTIRYSNVSVKPPDPALFRRPANCTTGPQPPNKGTGALPAAPPKTPPKPPEKHR